MARKDEAVKGVPETRSFKMHPQLLFDVIQRQAGTLTKAISEGVMNAIDAGAGSIGVNVYPDRVVISDNGKGFRNRSEIDLFFETFGQPHQAGDAVYGTFRMGRGQIFSFGRNLWHSGEFKMDVDIKNRGLDYELTVGNTPQPGCVIEIELYKPLSSLQVREIEDELRKAVRFAPVPIAFNGEPVNKDPGREKWDFVLPEAFIRFGEGRLAIYNLGVFVNDHRSQSVGIGGTVVSRRQLRLNFARNDILSDCPVWKRISTVLREAADRNITRKKTALNPEERSLLARRVRSGDMGDEAARNAPLFQDVSGHWLSLDTIRGRSGKYHAILSEAPKGNVRADRLMKSGVALILAQGKCEEVWGWPLAEVVERVIKPLSQRFRWAYRIVPYTELVDEDSTYEVLSPAEYSSVEEAVIRVCQNFWPPTASSGAPRRRVVLGCCEAADGWTDGSSYIAIARQFIATLDLATPASWARLGLLLCHEYMHGEPSSSDTHVHSPEFYELYHDHSDRFVSEFISRAMGGLPQVLEAGKKRADRKTLKELDRQQRIATAANALASVPLAARAASTPASAAIEGIAHALRRRRKPGHPQQRSFLDPQV